MGIFSKAAVVMFSGSCTLGGAWTWRDRVLGRGFWIRNWVLERQALSNLLLAPHKFYRSMLFEGEVCFI